MEKQPFLGSVPGRIVEGATGILIALAGVQAIAGPAHVDSLIPTAMSVGYIAFFVACGTAVQDHWSKVAAMVLAMPLVLGLYFVGLYWAAGAGAGIGVAFIIAGALVGSPSLIGRLVPGVTPGRPAQGRPA
jgi:hypothetical protein